jgi:hypothetical protein
VCVCVCVCVCVAGGWGGGMRSGLDFRLLDQSEASH